MTLPRLLVLMGSGETSPTMVKTHRRVFERLDDAAGGRAGGVLLDTPFGFQENADEIAGKAVAYFDDSVGRKVDVASWRRAGGDAVAAERAMVALRSAAWVFSGPGSPTYALRQWFGTPVPDALRDKLRAGGAVTFASAAALTLGRFTVPVYEIYKVGEEPRWEPGLDLLAEVGWMAAVIPHFDNAEGGGHDTRFCYLGETRLVAMEAELPDDAFVVGVDEHTGLVVDLAAGTAEVVGNGVVTVRRGGSVAVVEAGSTVAVEDVPHLATSGHGRQGVAPPAAEVDVRPDVERAATSLAEAAAEQEQAFEAALAARDVDGAVRAVLAVDDALAAWAADTLQSDERDRVRSIQRGMIVRLGELATRGVADPRDVVGPFVETLLELRSDARAAKDWSLSDRLRDILSELGIEVRDTPEGVEWGLVP